MGAQGMGVLNYSLISVIVGLSLLLGLLLGKIAREELKPGKKYIMLLFPACFAFVLMFSALSAVLHPVMIVFIVIAALLACCYRKINNLIYYFVLGFTFFLTMESAYFLPIASVMFIGNLAKGTELYMNKESKKNIALLIVLFLFVANFSLFF